MVKVKTKSTNKVIKLDTTVSKVEVVVNCNSLPVSIGDKIDIGDGIIRTVMKIQINEDAKITYGVQWVDGIDFKLDWFSWPELCYMHDIIMQKPKIGI